MYAHRMPCLPQYILTTRVIANLTDLQMYPLEAILGAEVDFDLCSIQDCHITSSLFWGTRLTLANQEVYHHQRAITLALPPTAQDNSDLKTMLEIMRLPYRLGAYGVLCTIGFFR